MRHLLAALLLVAAPAWGGSGSREFVSANEDYITLGDSDAFTFENGTDDDPLTAMFWCYIATGATVPDCFFGKFDSVSAASEWLIRADRCRMIEYSPTSAIGRIVSGGYPLDTWFHLACVYSGNESSTGIDIYLDGVASDDTDWNLNTYAKMDNTAEPLRVGCFESSGEATCGTDGNTSDGKTAYVSLYSRALSAAEVQSEMWCPGSVVSGLVVHLPLIDAGSTEYDRSGSGNDGTVTGADVSTDGPPVSLSCAGGN